MPTGRVITVIRTLVREPDDRPDGDLLNHFVAERDGAAFAELVRRHGRMVFGVCRRVLGHDHDAEDAFQAVWLVLARRAADVRPPGSVGPWLYGVAVRTAGKARALAMKRRRRQLAAARPEAVEDRPACDLGPVLDEELARLPTRYRAAVVACDLGGKSRSVAARDLGWPEGTVAARLAKARQLLAARLSRRGVTLSAATLTTAAVEPPEALAASAVGAALEFAAGSALVPPLARTLAEGVMRSMIAGKVKLWAVGVLLAATLAGGAALTAQPGTAPGDRPAPEPARKQAKKDGEVWKETKVLDLPGWLAGSLAYSPDGKALTVGGSGGHVVSYDTVTWNERWKTDAGGPLAGVAYTPDGKMVGATFKNGVWLLDAATGRPAEPGLLKQDGSAPTAVAFFPDVRPGPEYRAEPGAMMHHVLFGNAHSYFMKSWLKPIATSTLSASPGPGKKPPGDRYAVPIAPGPVQADQTAFLIGTLDDDANSPQVLVTGPKATTHTLQGHKATVTAAAWSKDGRTILTGDADGIVIQWDWPTLKEKRRLQLRGRVAALALTANGSRAAAVVIGLPEVTKKLIHYEDVFVWPTERPPAKPTPIAHHQGDSGTGSFDGLFNGIASVAFRPDGMALAASFCNLNPNAKQGGRAGRIRIWTLNTSAKPARKQTKKDGDGWKERKVLDLPGWLAGSLAYSPDGKSLAVGGSGGRVADFDAAAWKERWKADVGGKFAAVAYSPDGKAVAATFPDGVRFLEAATGKLGDVLEEKGNNPRAVAYIPQNKAEAELPAHKVIFGNALGYVVKVWVQWPKVSTITTQTVPEGKQPADLYAVPLATDPHGKRVVVTGPFVVNWTNIPWAWSAGSGADNKVMEGHKATMTAAAWSRDGRTILTGDAAGTVIQWDGTTFKEKRRLQLRGRIASLALTADGSRAAAAVAGLPLVMDEQVYYEDVFTWPTANPPAKPAPIARHQVGGAFKGVASVAFSPDGKSLAAAFCNFGQLDKLNELVGKVRIWTLADTKKPAPAKSAAPPPVEPVWTERKIPDAPAGYVWDVARSPDGKRFASAGHVWDAATLKKLYPLPGAWPGFSADGSKLFAIGEKSIDVTDAATGKRLATKPMPKKTFAWHRVAFSPGGKRYAVFDGVEVRLFDLDTGFEPVRLDGQLSGMPGYISGSVAGTGLDWSPDGKRLLGFSWVKGSSLALLLWDAATGKVIRTFDANNWPGTKAKNPFGSPAERAAFSPDGKTLILGGNSRLLLLDAATFKLNREIEIKSRDGGGADITAVALSADGKYVAAGYKLRDGKSPYHRVGVWDAATGKQFDTPLSYWGQPGQELPAVALAFVEGGRSLVIGVGRTSLAAFGPDGKPLVIGAGLTSKAIYDAGNRPPKDAGGLHVWRLTAKE